MTSEIADELVDAAARATPGSCSLERLCAWVRELSEPPAGVQLGSYDGALYTGIVVVHDNVPIAMLAFESSGARGGSGRRPRLRDVPRFDDYALDDDIAF